MAKKTTNKKSANSISSETSVKNTSNSSSLLMITVVLVVFQLIVLIGMLYSLDSKLTDTTDKLVNMEKKVNAIDDFFAQNVPQYDSSGNSATANTKGTATNTAGIDLSVITSNSDLFPSVGPNDAKDVVVEFIDFQCPFCGLASGLVPWADQYKNSQYSDLLGSATKTRALAEAGKIKYVEVTMSFLGQESVYAAEAGLCANKQGKFFEMEDAIFAAQTEGENSGKFAKDKLKVIAQSISGLNTETFNSCLDSDSTLNDVKQIATIAAKFASGTPTFYVNGKKTDASWTSIQTALGTQ